MTRILVAGDLIIDNNLVRLPGVNLAYSEMLPNAVLAKRPGNAWFLKDLVGIAFSDVKPELDIYAPGLGRSARTAGSRYYSQAYSIWAPFERRTGSGERVWRIERFLGCQPPEREAKPERYGCVFDKADKAGIDLLVLDDENMGFRGSKVKQAGEGGSEDQKELFERVLELCGDETKIVMKAAPPLGQGRLWDELSGGYADNLTVLLSAEHLRAQNAAISEPLSWDMAIEELEREFKEGLLLSGLSSVGRVVIYYKGAGVACYEKGRFRRFVYHPDELEGLWHAKRPGRTYGDLSILTAAISRYVMERDTYPLFVAAGRALAAIRAYHDMGYGVVEGVAVKELIDSFDAGIASGEIESKLHPDGGDGGLPESEFRAAFPRILVGKPSEEKADEVKSDLLQDFTGKGYEYVAAKATQVVLDGPDKALDSVPKARYGAYFTVDREEIERINEIRRLIISYQASGKDRKPLSIAVFGPPGAGKSFAIKQLASELFGEGQESIGFNLSQFSSRDELHEAFHQARDVSVRGQIPLVFWDEFDAEDLRWLKEFLAPMQDAEFQVGSVAHPFGKAIFVFAGSVEHDFDRFKDYAEGKPDKKGRDFISRLRAFVNIKGPNPQKQEGETWEEAAHRDVAHLIRRAILLRSVIKRFCSNILDPATGRASISCSVINGFLRVREFKHGARSLETVVSMSSLADNDYFGVAELPSPDLLSLHVTDDFMGKVREGELEAETIERLAEACHEAWRKAKWKITGESRETNPLMVPYHELGEKEKEDNRLTARVTQAKLSEIGYGLVPVRDSEKGAAGVEELTDEERTFLVEKEHEIWMRDKLLKGFDYAPETEKSLRLHCDIRHFDDISADDKKLDEAIVDEMPKAIDDVGFKLVKGEGKRGES